MSNNYNSNNSNMSPITNNRFNNNQYTNQPNYQQDQSNHRQYNRSYSNTPYYASGTASGNHPNHSTISNNNMVPFNGVFQQKHTVLPNTNCRNDYSNFDAPSIDVCQNTCVNDPNCQVWAYDNSNNKCYLNNIAKPCVPDSNYTSGYIFDRLSSGPFSEQFSEKRHNQRPGQGDRISTVIPDSSFPEQPYRTTNSNTVDACKNDCINDPQCNRWSFVNNTCALQNGKTSIVAKNTGSSSGEVYNHQVLPIPYNRQ